MDDLEDIMLNGIRWTKTNTLYYNLYMELKKKTNHKHNKTETESLILRTNKLLPDGEGMEEERNKLRESEELQTSGYKINES